uniref:Short-chain dehydrogenase n=1 Tax=Tetraselmis sp. GSL018 TaxID=582737 RepID=A0A061R5F7_9CHLO|mmetsp:Transcript_36598/g.86936  ORF Transcript_36598/g.86936 Transcript_36598/m.86936 type:complete len:277 (+) Transcript_36598:157-987(+)
MANQNFSMPDQVARHSKAKAENIQRVLNIDSVYDPSFLKDTRVLITGASRGLGLELAKECAAHGAKVIATTRAKSEALAQVPGVTEVTGIDVTSDESCKRLPTLVGDQPIDILINNAGYFYRPLETIENLNFDEELKMIDICAVGPLRVTAALFNAGLLKAGARVAMITSQGGSIAWRTVQNPSGHDFGHHMSKAAANMMGVLLNQELRGRGVMVTNLHPGFNRTDMTEKYKEAWDVEGAVEPSVGAKRVMHEISRMTPETAGGFVNCEDGLSIPW